MKSNFLTDEAKMLLVEHAARAAKKFKKEADTLIIAVRQEDMLRQSLISAFYNGYHECLKHIDTLIKKDSLKPISMGLDNLEKKIAEAKNVGNIEEQLGEPSTTVQPGDSSVLPDSGSIEPSGTDKG